MALQTWLALLLCLFFPRCLRLQPYFLYKRQEKRAYSFREQKNAQKIIVAASCHCRRGYERLFFRS
ncbi:Uncharacterised protein [Raoultella ornithinolytica]|nr:Uncharacterised protein [Raoultella ornithinolytica]